VKGTAFRALDIHRLELTEIDTALGLRCSKCDYLERQSQTISRAQTQRTIDRKLAEKTGTLA